MEDELYRNYLALYLSIKGATNKKTGKHEEISISQALSLMDIAAKPSQPKLIVKKQCRIDNCDNITLYKELCSHHYYTECVKYKKNVGKENQSDSVV